MGSKGRRKELTNHRKPQREIAISDRAEAPCQMTAPGNAVWDYVEERRFSAA
jgi:hypothetical protein